MFYVNVPNAISNCLSWEGYSPNSPFYKPFKLTELHLYKYSLGILHQQINSAAVQTTEREGDEAKPFPFPHPIKKGDMAFLLGTHCTSIQTVMKEQYVKVVLDTWGIFRILGCIYEKKLILFSLLSQTIIGQRLESPKWNRYPLSGCVCSFLI